MPSPTTRVPTQGAGLRATSNPAACTSSRAPTTGMTRRAYAGLSTPLNRATDRGDVRWGTPRARLSQPSVRAERSGDVVLSMGPWVPSAGAAIRACRRPCPGGIGPLEARSARHPPKRYVLRCPQMSGRKLKEAAISRSVPGW